MRKTLLSALAALALAAAVFTPTALAGELTTGSLMDTSFQISASELNLVGKSDGAAQASTGQGIKNVNVLAAKIVRLAMIALSLVCTVLIVAGGIVMATAGGNEDRVSKGKTMVMYSLVGLFVALSSYAIIAAAGWALGG